MTKGAYSLARWVSVIAHPFVMVFLMVGMAAVHAGSFQDAGRNAGIVALFAVLPVALLTVKQMRQGAWTTVDASRSQERPALYAVGIAGMAALVIYLVMSRPDSVLLRGSSVALALLVVCAVTTRWIKVSLHVASAALTATALILSGSAVGWIVAGVVPVLMWSRLALGRHTLAEVALGLLFGIVFGVAMHFP